MPQVACAIGSEATSQAVFANHPYYEPKGKIADPILDPVRNSATGHLKIFKEYSAKSEISNGVDF